MIREYRISLFDDRRGTTPDQYLDLLRMLTMIPDDSVFVCVDYRLACSHNLVCVAIRSESFVDSDAVHVERTIDRLIRSSDEG
jgi:hypothetical protein